VKKAYHDVTVVFGANVEKFQHSYIDKLSHRFFHTAIHNDTIRRLTVNKTCTNKKNYYQGNRNESKTK